MKGNEELVSRLSQVLRDLLERTGASRVTLRVDIPGRGFGVNIPAAEALAPGVRSLMQEGSLNQREAETVKWLVQERRTLVQNDVFSDGPAPPQALVESYGTRGQMLGPLFRDDWLVGWISVHNNFEPRTWEEADIEALEKAMLRVHMDLFGAPA